MAGTATSQPLKHSVAKRDFALVAKPLELVQMASTVLLMLKEWVEKAGLMLGEGSEVGLWLSWRFCLIGSTLPHMLLVPAGCGGPGEMGAAASVLTELACSSVSAEIMFLVALGNLSFFPPCSLNLSIAPCPFPWLGKRQDILCSAGDMAKWPNRPEEEG